MDSHISSSKLPLIDLSQVDVNEPGTLSWDSIQNDVRRALEEYGCFEARYDKVTEELHDDVFGWLDQLFKLPKETKRRFVNFDPENQYNGYLADLPDFPLHEAMSMAVGAAGNFDSTSTRRLTDLMWPTGNSSFSDTLNSYTMKVSDLDKMIKKMVFRSFGLEAKYLASHNKTTAYSLRLLRYGAPKCWEPQPGGITHYDINFLTILKQNGVDGLEIETKDGKWIKVSPSRSTFIIMMGESFQGWSNGRLHCARHRVMMTGDETRYSVGFFSSVKGTIECPEELVDKQHPVLYKPFDQNGLVRIFATRGLHGASALKTFYSV